MTQGVREFQLRYGELRDLGGGPLQELVDQGLINRDALDALAGIESDTERQIRILRIIQATAQERDEASASVVADALLGGTEGELALSLAVGSSQRLQTFITASRESRVTSLEAQRAIGTLSASMAVLGQDVRVLTAEAMAPFADEVANALQATGPLVDTISQWAAESDAIDTTAQTTGALLQTLIDIGQQEGALQTLEQLVNLVAVVIRTLDLLVRGLSGIANIGQAARAAVEGDFSEAARLGQEAATDIAQGVLSPGIAVQDIYFPESAAAQARAADRQAQSELTRAAAIQRSQDRAVAEAVARAEAETAARAAGTQVIVNVDGQQVAAALEQRTSRAISGVSP